MPARQAVAHRPHRPRNRAGGGRCGGRDFGDAPNIAARVQALAEPGAVLVTARVQRQVAGLFVAEERGSHDAQRRAGAGDSVPARAGERRRTPLRRSAISRR